MRRGIRPATSVPQQGFTLIEVLAALVIVALGMIAAIQAVTQSARNGTYLREKTLAHWIGMNVITERRLQSSPPDVAESTGRLEYAGQQWQWGMKVTQTQVASLRRMDVVVGRADAPEGAAPLATVSGFYGTAVGGAGGSGQASWSGGGAAGGGERTDDDDERMNRDDKPRQPAPSPDVPMVPDE